MPNEELIGFIDSTALLENEVLISSSKREWFPPNDAQTLISNHAKQVQDLAGNPKPIELKTNNGKAIKGFYFPRTEIETALGEDATGIYLAFGIHDGKVIKGLYGNTIILYGVKPDTPGGKEYTIEVDSRIFDYSKPCPDNCPKRP